MPRTDAWRTRAAPVCRGAHGGAALLLLMIAALATAPHAAQQGAAAPDGAPQENRPQDASPAQGGNGQSPAADAGQQPTFRGAIDFVTVDAFVTDRDGKPITDLTEADFEVLEDGKPQDLQQFRSVKIDGLSRIDEPVRRIRTPDDERLEGQRDDVRVFVFFLDDYHTRDRNAIAIRPTLATFIKTNILPTDMLAVMYPLTSVNDVIFTRDHERVINAIDHFEGRKYDYTPRYAVEENYMRAPTTVVERIRNEVVSTALEGLSMRLGGVREGRKTVIFVSEGFTVSLPPQMRRSNAQAPQMPGAGGGDTQVEAMEMAQNQLELDNRMRDVYRAAARNNTSFYALDPRGLSPFEFDINDGGAAGVPNQQADALAMRSAQDTLRELALETDGRAILNRNSLGEGLAQVVRDSSFYYLLGYTTQAPTDGKFHEIRVRVKRSGATVRSRKGYWAFTTEDVERVRNKPAAPAGPNRAQQALASIATSVQAARWVRTWVGTERGENGKTRLTLTWEPLPIQQGLRREQAGRVSLLAATAEGGLVYRGRSPDTAAPEGTSPASRTGAAPAAAALASAPRRIAFEAPPGKLELRLTIEAAGGGTLDTETRTIDIPDLTVPKAALSTPRVFRARTARDFQAHLKDAAAVPVAAREFSRTERLLIRFDAYGAGSETPAPAAAILARDGKKIADLPVAPAAAGGTHQLDVALNTMASGEYVIEITVTDASGTTASELVPIRIGA